MKKTEFDFEEWAKLAQEDPEAFETKRSEMIAEIIENAPAERRIKLRQLQWKIDATRKLAKNPLDSCIKISTMLLDNFYGEGGLVDALTRLSPTEHTGLRELIIPSVIQEGKIISLGK